MQLSSTGPTFITHLQPPDTKSISTVVYMQPPDTKFPPRAHMPPCKRFLPKAYMQLSRSTSVAYIQPLGTGPLLAAYISIDIGPTPAAYTILAGYTQPLTGYAHLINHSLSGNNPPAAMITTSIGHSRE